MLASVNIVYVANKIKPRGRFRRNLELCLAEGHTVKVVIPRSLVREFDLDHLNLEVVEVEIMSLRLSFWNLVPNPLKKRIKFGLRKHFYRILGSSSRIIQADLESNHKSKSGTSPSSQIAQKTLSASRFVRSQRRNIRRVLGPINRMSRNYLFWKESERYLLTNPKVDLIWSHDFPGLVGASWASKKLKVRQLHDCSELYAHSTGIGFLERTVINLFERRSLRRCSKIIVVNESIQKQIWNKYRVESLVVRNCTSYVGSQLPASIDLRKDCKIDSEVNILIYSGGYQKGRGLETLLKSSWQLPQQWNLILIGYGNIERELKSLVVNNPLVKFLDSVPPEELLSIMSQADVGVIPYEFVSLNNTLALPNKVFEYAAAGLGIISTKLPEVSKILEQGLGVTFEQGDTDSFIQALTHLSEENILNMKISARRWYLDNSWDAESRVIKDYLDESVKDLK